MSKTKFVYSLSDTRSFKLQVFNSLKSLSLFVKPKDIIVIVNPKSNSRGIRSLSRFCTVYQGNPYYENLDLPPFRYKIEMCDIDADNIVFLDCDTIIMDDPKELIDGDFDVMGRQEPCMAYEGEKRPSWDQEEWERQLKRFGKPTDSIAYNDGFIILKNGIHKKIKKDFIKYYKMYANGELKSPNTTDDSHHNAFALSLALAGYKAKHMNTHHHWYGWRAENFTSSDKTYVLHIGTSKNDLQGYLYNLSRHHIGEFSVYA